MTFVPSSLSVLVGLNASGKSNFASALDFLADVHKFGLELALAKKGGFDNIAFRKVRRSKSPIVFEIEVDLDREESTRAMRAFSQKMKNSDKARLFRFTHSFSFRADNSTISSGYRIVSESITIFSRADNNSDFLRLIDIQRERNIVNAKAYEPDDSYVKSIVEYINIISKFEFSTDRNPHLQLSLFITGAFSGVSRLLGAISVFQFSPKICREPGIPSSSPMLSAYGENLPAIVDWLKKFHPNIWKKILGALRDIIPNLIDVSVQYLHTKTLGLSFEEENVGRKWNAEDISDGTIQTLAILVALYDPRSTVLLIEEPENSVHPRIVRLLMEHLRALSKQKPVIVTTHSPELINLVFPSEVWIACRVHGETQLKPLTVIDPLVELDWTEGRYKLYEYLSTDSGSYQFCGS